VRMRSRIDRAVVISAIMLAVLLIVGCSDRYIIVLINESQDAAIVHFGGSPSAYEVAAGSTIKVTETSRVDASTIQIQYGTTTSRVRLRDVDHWAAVTHELSVRIQNSRIEVSGTRNELYVPQE
jgi:hypothetical protein